MIKSPIWIVLLSLLIPGMGVSAAEIQVGHLLYASREANGEEVTNRLLATPKMLRIDQPGRADGYILYDREAGIIYSVTPEEQSILVIQPQPDSVRKPRDMGLKVEPVVDFSGPEISGSKPQQWQLIVDDQICRNAILVPGLMTEMLVLYRDYLRLLADQHYMSLDAIPAEYRDPCDDAIDVFAPGLLLQKGLPIRTWERNGKQQRLLEFSDQYSVDASLFRLPADYQRRPMSKMK
jgi:hypothetical protein